MDRRAFLARSAAVASGTLAGSEALARLANRAALADMTARARGYGTLILMGDQRGRKILALPRGFSYVTFGDIGSPLSDGRPTPLALDGMAAFRGPRGTVRLIRNHEDRNVPPAGSLRARPGAYDEFAWGWLTGEETIAGPSRGFAQRHGSLFEVPLRRAPDDPPHSRPLRAMGRFTHEAAATDHRTGIVGETEDPGSGRGAGFYRFIPNHPRRLAAGGRLQILGIRGSPQHDARDDQRAARKLPVRWIDSTSPTPSTTTRTTRAAPSSRAGTTAPPSSTGSRGAGMPTAASSSSPPAAATSRPATSTPTATAKAAARCGSTACTSASSSCTTNRPAARSWTRPTT